MSFRTFIIYTFGCKVNTYESVGVKEYLEKKGLVLTGNNPDIVLVNTCAVTATSEKKCIAKVKSIADRNPNARIGVFGCSSQLHSERYYAIPNVLVVGGNAAKLEIVDVLLQEDSKKANLVRKNIRNSSYESGISISRFEHEVRAFLKIQDGCDNFCSYCVIPLVRGNSRSRPKNDIIAEAQRLFANNYREIVITGIDMGSYCDPKDISYALDDLLTDLIGITPDNCRLRVSSLEASQITKRTIELYASYPNKLVNHLHIPLQSGSKRILDKMNRKYDLNKFKLLTQELKNRVPDIGLSTDVIVGFPGETEEMFEETYKFCEDVGFMRMHVFPYSERPNTVAANLGHQVELDVRKQRVHRLMRLSEFLSEQFRQQMSGKYLDVLFESFYEMVGESHYKGYSSNYLEIDIISQDNLIGEIRRVQILENGVSQLFDNQ